MAVPQLTLGIEEEYQIIDPRSRELRSYIQEFLEQGREVLKEQIRSEFLQSQVEVGSHICHDIKEARKEIIRLRRTVADLAEQNGLKIAAASTHPFSQWTAQHVTAGERYTQLATDLAEVARRLLIFGMHVHVGIPDPDLRIEVMNAARAFLPHLLALSASSPYWQGRETGLSSYRSVVFESLPRTGIPPVFASWREFARYLDTLQRTRCVDDPTKVWWDLRPHAKLPTLEFRITDICTRVDEAICLAALVQALVAKLITLRPAQRRRCTSAHHLITENKWRAVRYGIQGSLVDFAQQREVPTREQALKLLEFIDDVVDELGVREEVSYVYTILKEGTSADRQVRVYRERGDLRAVVDHLIAETCAGID